MNPEEWEESWSEKKRVLRSFIASNSGDTEVAIDESDNDFNGEKLQAEWIVRGEGIADTDLLNQLSAISVITEEPHLDVIQVEEDVVQILLYRGQQ